MWLRRFPQQTQAMLSNSKDSLNNIAEISDKMIAFISTCQVCSVTNKDSSPKSTDRNKLEALQADIAVLKQFEEFSRYYELRRSKSNSSRYAFCWYHFMFRRNAKKCTQPCQFKREISKKPIGQSLDAAVDTGEKAAA
ncbi:uncharacterized protein TNCT_402391 [Trichonephila clavata]|uniref:Uncharacterized protein n=1 Tax=Trichonephila clavata TaxID=2740835 RepID=A0A8X6H4K7_TRICU|nr:uncharacterized protein TNCT_402391 [Trichonephila clavata]